MNHRFNHAANHVRAHSASHFTSGGNFEAVSSSGHGQKCQTITKRVGNTVTTTTHCS